MKNETIDDAFRRFRNELDYELCLLLEESLTDKESRRIWNAACKEYREFIKEHPEELER